MIFYFKITLVLIWFVITSLISIIVGLIRWRHPSGGYVFTSLFTWGSSRILGIKLVVKDAQRLLDSQPCIYIGNHQSNLDMLVQAHCYRPRTVCIGKKELIWIPFFGALFFLSGNILLDRKNHDRAMEGMAEAKDFLVSRRISIYMFPEGTRNKGATTLLPFKKGAFHLAIAAQVPIVPVVSAPVYKFIDFKNKKINTGVAHVEVLEAIATTGMTQAHLAQLMDTAYQRMQTAFARLSI